MSSLRLCIAFLALAVLPANAQTNSWITPTGTLAYYGETTISAVLGTAIPLPGLVASVIYANACATALTLSCTESRNPTCIEFAQYAVTATEGPYFLSLNLRNLTGPGPTADGSCELSAPGPVTIGNCSFSSSVDPGLVGSGTTEVGEVFTPVAVTVTGGVEKLKEVRGSCTEVPMRSVTSSMMMTTSTSSAATMDAVRKGELLAVVGLVAGVGFW